MKVKQKTKFKALPLNKSGVNKNKKITKTNLPNNSVTTLFDESVNNRLAKIKELLLIKGAEYIRNNDKYHNFKRTAEMNRTTETRALHGMSSKHIVSILDMLDDIDAGKKIEVKFVEEKIGDLMVYLVILEALIKEKYSSPGF